MGASEPVRRVRIPALLIAVNHVGVAERLLNGQPRAEAFAAAYQLYYGLLVPAAKLAWWQQESLLTVSQLLHPGLAGTAWLSEVDSRHWTMACFAAAAADAAPYLRDGEPGDAPVPSIVLPAAEADRLAWQLEAMRRYSTGGDGHDLCACARGAIDQAAGRPRQKRAPVDSGWLAAQVGEALDHVWERLRADAKRAGGSHVAMLWQEPRQSARTMRDLARTPGAIWALVGG